MKCPFLYSITTNQSKTYIQANSISVSFLRLAKIVQSYRNFLFKNLVRPNQCFVSLSSNPLVNISLLWTCLQLKISFLPINPKFPEKKISSLLQSIQPNFVCYPPLFSSQDLAENLQHCLFFSEQIFEEILKNSKEISLKQLEKEPALQSFDFSTLLLSSGTSGTSKFIAHKLDSHILSAQGINQVLNFDSDCSWFLSLPIFHISGLSLAFRALIAGASLTDDLSQATHISFVPSQLNTFLQNPPLQKFKAILLGGAPISDSLLQKAAEKNLPVFFSYGLTETASAVYLEKIQLSPSRSLLRTQIPIPHRQIKVQAKTKLIRVQGNILASGFKKIDSNKFLPLLEEDGWFTTPDLGKIQNHLLKILGRSDLVFICGGENVSPTNVETQLLSIPGVLQVLVVEKFDPSFDLVPVAFILLDSTSSLDDVISFAKNILSYYEIPKQWFNWPEQWNNLVKPCRNTAKNLIQENLAVVL